MDFFRRFTFLVSAPAFDADDLEGHRFNQIIEEIESWASRSSGARIEDAEIAVQTDAAIGCMVVDWGKKGLEGKTAALINLMRRRGLDFPIILLIRRKRLRGRAGRGARLHRRLYLPLRGDAGPSSPRTWSAGSSNMPRR